MQALESALTKVPIIAILRGVEPHNVIDVASAVLESGISVIEVPLNSPAAIESITRLSAALGDQAIIGCGTCITVQQAAAVVKAGARIMVTPNSDTSVIKRAIQHGMLPIPGWATPSEAFAAYHAGARYMKLFPAATYGTSHLLACRAVLPKDARIVAVGGVTASNAAQWFAAGACAIGVGSELYMPDFSVQEIRLRAQQITQQINQLLPR